MRDTFFYIEANFVCLLIFIFILIKNLTRVDRQARQRCFDRVLILHSLYFIADSLWILLYSNTIQMPNDIFADLIDVLLFSLAAFGAYNWYLYLEIMLEADFVKSARARLVHSIPAYISTGLAVVGCLRNFNYWGFNGGKMHTTWLYCVMTAIPIMYVAIAAGKAFYEACKKENAPRRHTFISVGVYPLAIILSAVLQILNLKEPLLCFGCTVAMIYVYVNSLDNLISQDPLTQLNNRNELKRFLLNTQHRPETNVYLLMMDVNKFKSINDRFGHLEGDRALRCIADSLKEACTKCTKRHFIARYGGDEFIVAAIAEDESEVKELCALIHSIVAAKNKELGLAYDLSLSIGYARLGREEDAVQHCLAAADAELYKQKQARNKASLQAQA